MMRRAGIYRGETIKLGVGGGRHSRLKEHDMFKNKETEKIIDIQYTSDSVIPNLKPLAVWH